MLESKRNLSAFTSLTGSNLCMESPLESTESHETEKMKANLKSGHRLRELTKIEQLISRDPGMDHPLNLHHQIIRA